MLVACLCKIVEGIKQFIPFVGWEYLHINQDISQLLALLPLQLQQLNDLNFIQQTELNSDFAKAFGGSNLNGQNTQYILDRQITFFDCQPAKGHALLSLEFECFQNSRLINAVMIYQKTSEGLNVL